MTPRLSRRGLLAGVATAVVGGLAGCSAPLAETTRETNETYDPAPEVDVENVNGSVRVESTADDVVRLETTLRSVRGNRAFDEVTVNVDRDGDTLRVVAEHDRQRVFPVTVDLRIELPGGTELDRVRTQNGTVRVANVAGDAELLTTNGTVRATGLDGFLTARTTNGNVEVAGVTGIDEILSTNGRVDAEIRAVRTDAEVQTTNGNVVATVGSDLDADIDASTTNGSVSTTRLQLSDLETSRTRVTGRAGDGGHVLRVRTTNGDVRLEGQG